MKTTIVMLKLAALFNLAAFFGFVAHLGQEPAPSPISVTAPTEQSIKEDIRHDFEREQLEKQYRRAAVVAGRIYRKNHCRQTYADLTGQVAIDYGVSPAVLAALVFVESSCNPNAVSGRKSVGLTQVNPLAWKYTKIELMDPEKNLRVGAQILAHYVHRHGLVEGLHHYNGMGNPTNEYAEKVLTAAGIQI